MGICKGNRGNLMQHWTFSEVLNSLKSEIQNLHLITTHSMTPWAIPEKQDRENRCRRVFITAGKRLDGYGDPSVYESAWESLAVDSGLPYPSTAAFATRLWQADKISIAICEFDSKAADEVDGWLSTEETANRFSNSILFRGDWRKSIQSPQIWNSEACCTYIEMDPMRYDVRDEPQRRSTSPASLYPEDFVLLVNEMKPKNGKVVLQISSYSTQNAMTLDAQLASMTEILQEGCFEFQSQTRVGKQMGSFLFAKGLKLEVGDLRQQFDIWLQGANQHP